jgi:phosphoglycerate dehydrogenase-like enzyme
MNILMVPNPLTLTDLTDNYRKSILEAAGPDSRIVVGKTAVEQTAYAPEADVVLGIIPKEVFLATARLRYVQSLSAGVDEILYPEFVNSSVALASEKGIVGNQLAEHAFGMLLAFNRDIAGLIRLKGWIKDRPAWRRRLSELSGKTMGVIGLGGTGRAVAKRAVAFGMRVIATDIEEVAPSPDVEQLWPASRFYDLLEASDVVVVCCPLTGETKGLFDREAFRRMRRGAILINVTRGEIVIEDAVVQALKDGTLAGAGLDVTPREPLPPDSELWQLENCIVGCHNAGASQFRADRVINLFCNNLRHLRAGEPLEGLIDKQKGY